jgi:DNA-binding response OmpR family regulator
MGRRILIVEDDNAIRDFLCNALADECYEVASANNGQAALALVHTLCPDLILLDMWMPIMDGEQFLRLYHELTLRKAPIIGLSASGRTERIARRLGVSDFLIKPIDLNVLLTTVRLHLEPV